MRLHPPFSRAFNDPMSTFTFTPPPHHFNSYLHPPPHVNSYLHPSSPLQLSPSPLLPTSTLTFTPPPHVNSYLHPSSPCQLSPSPLLPMSIPTFTPPPHVNSHLHPSSPCQLLPSPLLPTLLYSFSSMPTGQFWSVPVTKQLYQDPNLPGDQEFQPYLLTVYHPNATPRSFVASQYSQTWDRTPTPCYYAGSSQGGLDGASHDSVIEGSYSDYKVSSLESYTFKYSRFNQTICATSP